MGTNQIFLSKADKTFAHLGWHWREKTNVGTCNESV